MSQTKTEISAANLKMIENYHAALSTVRKRYFEQATAQTINSDEQSATIDHLLVLDFMLESNQQLLDYLNHFKKHQRAQSTKAFEEILGNLTSDDHENIHETILRFKRHILDNGPGISQTLRDDYDFKGKIYGAFAIGFGILAFSLGPILGSLMDPMELAMVAALGASGSTILIFALIALVILVVSLMMFCKDQAELYIQPESPYYPADDDYNNKFGRTTECLKVCSPSPDPAETSLFTKSYEKNFKTYEERRENHSLITITTTLFAHNREQPRGALRETFMRDLAPEVTAEYNTPSFSR